MLNKVNMCLFIIVSIFEIYETLRSHIMLTFRFVSLFWMTSKYIYHRFSVCLFKKPSSWKAQSALIGPLARAWAGTAPPCFFMIKKNMEISLFFFPIQDLYAPSRNIKALDHIHTAAIFLRVGSSRVVLQVCKSSKRRESDELLAFHPFLFD